MVDKSVIGRQICCW